jgi:hypothetical protein
MGYSLILNVEAKRLNYAYLPMRPVLKVKDKEVELASYLILKYCG